MTGFLEGVVMYLGGSIATALIVFPMYMRSWNEGYNTAKKVYSDWSMGYKMGFEDGAISVIKSMEEVNEA